MGAGALVLIAFGVYVAIQFYKGKSVAANISVNVGANKPGVSYYDPVAVTQRPQQLAAFETTNPGYGNDGASATQPGYAPAFGPNENQPAEHEEFFS